MQSFWAFINRKETRVALAIFCFCLAFDNAWDILWHAQTRMELFRYGGGLLLWLSWALINLLHSMGKVAPKLSIAVNVGIGMMLIGYFMGP